MISDCVELWGFFLGFDSKKLARDPLGLVDCAVHPLLDGLVSVGTGEDWKPGMAGCGLWLNCRGWLEQWVQGVV